MGYTTDILSFMPRAQAKAEVKPEEKSGSIAGKVVANYTKIAGGANPTRFKAINLAARAMFAILAIAPYAIATVGALFADAAFMTARGISNAYNAIRNRFSKAPEAPKAQEPAQSIKEKVLDAANKAKDFAKEHPTFVKVAAATVATIGSAYLYKRFTQEGFCAVDKVCNFDNHGGLGERWIDQGGSCVLKKIPPLRALKKEAKAIEGNAITEFVKENPVTSTIGGLVTANALAVLGALGFNKYQARKAAGSVA